MFDSHWPELTRKRVREDDGEGNGQIGTREAMSGSLGFTEHRSKRLQSLPLRTSPAQKRWPGPPRFPHVGAVTVAAPTTITPTDSDSEDLQYQQQPSPAMDVDRDTDMTMDSSPQYPAPDALRPDRVDLSVTGRMPTPIHCTFAAQVRGCSWGPINHTIHPGDRSTVAAVLEDGVGFAAGGHSFPLQHDDSSVPRSLGGAEWSMVQNRRLPSPISESGGEETPTSPGMVLDSRLPASSHLQTPRLPTPHAMAIHPNIQTLPPAADGDTGMMDTDPTSTSTASAPATPSLRGKFGHSRSKHTLNSWTLQPGMKRSFSIGYRADCEKCRMKIPGHFNHIIIS
ncbi:hypothetical protein GGS23DRAFT_394808 [Durotheca rogersii]|uniref:uncharacterized protein n=1 Tax=Durotheca rogersii TaxID=419775 RepID=UPI002220D1A5|nr:uncharacterized protein GGS23DRAFT_394808 [Durotheca rogersii]KAI5856680.1 hypothetical protein GGS23DRAFT_394808 [Durotheca rogersii]